MAEPTRLRTVGDRSQQDVCDVLRQLLARAEAGEFRSVVVALERHDDTRVLAGSYLDDFARTLGSLQLLAAKVMRAAFDE